MVTEVARPAKTRDDLTAGRAAAAIAVGLLFILGIAVAIRHIELVTGQYLSNGVPPLPAFAGILVLSLLRPVLRRYLPRLAPMRGQILLIYAMLTIGVTLNGLYHVRAFLPQLVALQYWGKEGTPLFGYARYLPGWYAPRDPEAIRHYYQSAPDGSVPWSVWVGPLAWWSLFFLALFIGLFSLASLIERPWIRDQKLSFPLLTIPLALTAEERFGSGSPAARRTLFMLGFGVALLWDGINILHTLYPSIPAPGFAQALIQSSLDRPWTPLRSVILYFTLETIGIGYFVPLEITFSMWFFYLLNRLTAIAGAAAGYDDPGFPFTQEQSAGGYIAVGLLLLWGLRRALWASLKTALGLSRRASSTWAERGAWIGLCGSTLFILGFCQVAGFSLRLVLPFFGVLGLFVLVYTRIRGEAGVPFGFVYPDGLAKAMVLNTLSVPLALQWGGTRSFVLFSTFGWLSRFHHPLEQAAYHLDSRKLASEGRIPRRTLFAALLLAFVVGLGAAFWSHLGAYYAQGSNLIASAGGIGEYREAMARQEYEQMAAQLSHPPLQNTPRLVATLAGFCFAGALALLRARWVSCPFHPLGFLMATALGDTATSWFPMLVAWTAKSVILRIGGLPLYRRGMPFFLGLAIGHFFLGGLFWPIFSLFIPREAANAYHLVFGE